MKFQTNNKNRRAIAYWLLAMAFLVFAMVIVGGATRLTESGLSMVNWNPVTGVVPPITDTEWATEFSNYKLSPEYKLKNHGMSVDEFKGIFYWEWGHRLLGRVIGLAFALPLIFFWIKGMVPVGYKPKLLTLFILGGSQGLLGWYMVMSGLVDEPAVSHYRLTAHLMLALFIFAALLWTALDLLNPKPVERTKSVVALSHALAFVVVLQLIMGALVAGLKAGHIFNTWPLMGETFIPPYLWNMQPVWRNLLDNAVTTQFDHRIGAYVLLVLVGLLFIKSRRNTAHNVKKTTALGVMLVTLQVFIGIVMLLKNVPVDWGTYHQGGGVVVLAWVVYLLHIQRKNTAA